MKKKSLYASERGLVRCAGKVSGMEKTITPDMAEHLVFLDESRVNTDLIRLYGRCPFCQRVTNHAPLEHTTDDNRAFLDSIQRGKVFYNLSGWNNKGTVCPIFERDATSNPAAGRYRGDGQSVPPSCQSCPGRLGTAGIEVRYLPPYSPDFNPTEKCGLN